MASLADNEIIEEFVAESKDHLNLIDPDLLAMEKTGSSVSPDVINRIFRAIHSIKGAAGFFGFESLKNMAHAMESVLMQVRDGNLPVTSILMDPLFVGVDRLKSMVEDIYNSNDFDITADVAPLDRILGKNHDDPAAHSSTGKDSTEDAEASPGPAVQAAAEVLLRGVVNRQVFSVSREAVRSALGQKMRLFHVRAFLHKDIQAHWPSPLTFLNQVLSLGELMDSHIDASDIVGLEDNPADQDLAMSLLVATTFDPGLVSGALELPEASMQELVEDAVAGNILEAGTETAPSAPGDVKPDGSSVGMPAPAGAPAIVVKAETIKPDLKKPDKAERRDKDVSQETLRIRVDLLTNLMNLAGELVLGRNQLMRALAGEARESGLGAILQNINQVTSSLQEGIMQTRMQPADSIFNRFPRIIRDMSKQLGKQIELEIQGSEVELDKSLVEGLTDPLTHIIRNSADHAIEMPEERRLAGKEPTGHIVLRAYHQDGHVNISIQDDGKGIDAERVGRKAVDKGIITQAQAAQMTERELVNLIFAPGFSTVDTVSELSGRGVGMDVVRSNTEKMGGTVDVETTLGKGTTILLRLPLTLAIIPSMIVGVADQRFAIPQVHVVEFVSVRAADLAQRVERVNASEVLRLRDRLLPLVHLGSALKIRAPRAAGLLPAAETESEPQSLDYHIVVLGVGSNQFGIVVDELFDIEEIVVKPISVFAQNCKCFSGATIVGDGHVIMILDVAGLVSLAGLQFADLEAENKRRLELEKQNAALTASQLRPIILCTGAPDEYFAIPQDSILRLEMFPRSSIQHLGEQEFVNYRGKGLPLIRLERLLHVRPVDPALKEIFVVIPKVIENGSVAPAQAGIVISGIIDALEVDVQLQPIDLARRPRFTGQHAPGSDAAARGSSSASSGVLGSAVLEDNLTLFLKLDEILKAAVSLPSLLADNHSETAPATGAGTATGTGASATDTESGAALYHSTAPTALGIEVGL